MGNYISCTLLGHGGGHHMRTSKVIFPGGKIREFEEPVKAAELMLEKPNFFLVNSQSLHIGRRFSALNADEDLETANVYAMFPMKRMVSTVTASDMAVLFLATNSAAKGASSAGRMRISPELREEDAKEEEEVVADEKTAVNLNLDDIEEFSSPEFIHRLSMCRSKKPLLETIVEEPVSSR